MVGFRSWHDRSSRNRFLVDDDRNGLNTVLKKPITVFQTVEGLLSDVVSDEYEREMYFDSQIAIPTPVYPNSGHSIHRRESGGAVFSSDDFKFRQGTCFYIALPIGIVATINMVLLLVEGITRVRNAPDDNKVR